MSSPVVAVIGDHVVLPGRRWIEAALDAALEQARRDGVNVEDPEVQEAGRILNAVREACAERESVPLRNSVPPVGSVEVMLTSKQVARQLGVSERAVVKRAKALGGTKPAGRWVFSATDIERRTA